MSLFRRPAKDGIYYIDLGFGSGRVKRSTGTRDRATAEIEHEKVRRSLRNVKVAGKTLSDALLAWLDDRPRHRNDLSNLRIIRAAHPDCPLHEVSNITLREALKDKSPVRYNRLMTIVRRALHLARDNGWIDVVPVFKARHEPKRVETEPLTWEEWERLRAELPEHLQDMADFALATGMRWENVSLLEWNRVSLENRSCWVYAWQAKGRVSINIPLSVSAMAVLERRRVHPDAETGFVFTYRGLPVGSGKTAWGKARVRAGLQRFRWHDLRHTFASWHTARETPPQVLKALGTWSSMRQVERYSHLAPTHVAQYAENSRPIETSQKTSQSKRAKR